MKTIIAGSRSIQDYNALKLAIILSKFNITSVVCGEAQGVDSLGKRWALENKIPVQSFPANWAKYGRQAGFLRNKQMVEFADQCLILWDGSSRGTNLTINLWKTIHREKNIKIFTV